MTDKEKIIAHIEKLLEKYPKNYYLTVLWDYIDSLQEEPVGEELKVELEKYIKDHFTIDTEQLDRFGIEEKDYMYSMDKSDMLALVEHFINWHKSKEEPASEEWIEELKIKLDSMSKEDFKKVFDKYAIDFDEEPVSEDLEEASKEWLEPQLDKSYVSYGEGKMMELTHFDGYAMLDAIEFGAQWKEEQMMAKAIDGKLFRTYDNSSFKYKIDIDCDIRIDKYKDGEKVKVIIVKED